MLSFSCSFVNYGRKKGELGPRQPKRYYTPTNTPLYSSRIYDDFRYGLWWPKINQTYQRIQEDSIGQAYNFFDKNNSYISAYTGRPCRRAPFMLRSAPRRSFYARYLDNYVYNQI